MSKKQDNQNITWLQVNNIVPIVLIVVSSLLGYGVTLTRIAVLENKIDYMTRQQDIVLQTLTSVEGRYGRLAVQVGRVEERLGMKKTEE